MPRLIKLHVKLNINSVNKIFIFYFYKRNLNRQIQIYNTLTRKKEEFDPIVENHVGMYVCGPTVYGDPHLGHARPGITFDVVFRYLKHSDYSVRYVRNITDAGHLENSMNVVRKGKKNSNQSQLEQLEPMEVVQFYTLSYNKAMESFNDDNLKRIAVNGFFLNSFLLKNDLSYCFLSNLKRLLKSIIKITQHPVLIIYY